MRIVIAGAGEMGSHLAKMLSGNGHDITIVDKDPKALDVVGSLADIITVEGDSTAFATLRKASVRKCDLFIAVNHEENDNVVAATLAKQLGAKKSIARIDNEEYLEPNNKEMFIEMGIDYLFYPEKVAASEVINLLGHTSTTEYVDFSSGKLSLVVFRLDPASSLIGRKLSGFSEEEGLLAYRTVAISRGGQTIIPRPDECFMGGDTVYVIARQDAVREVMEFSGQSSIEIKNMMILGGSRIGIQIASALQDDVNVKLVDYSADWAYRLAEVLERTLIINEDGRNTEAMMEEGLSNMDAFVAVTGRSETNILTAMLAKRLGVKKVIAEVENMNYINLAESIGIDTIINKKLVTASNIFRFTMSTDVQAIKCLTGSDAEVLEFIVKPNSPATKSRIRDMDFPDDAIIGGIVRGDKVFIAVGNTEINAYDRVVVFAMRGSVGRVGYYFN
ncbi:Trk system potassium transporter TrkA [uncultured Alistipes sp.]|uniref:Trk system potassium transporter TrkA n=1 Tax=uncultured Alistipes sp. TaxID=538949 RepID=UPI002617ED94|nr:Trk system potassium transporter TrkA [uncultured Alistipes sp.]